MLPSIVSGWVLCFVVLCGVLSTPLVLSAPRSYYFAVEIYSRYVEGAAPVSAAASLLLIGVFLLIGAVALTVSVVLRRRANAASRRIAEAQAESDPSTRVVATREAAKAGAAATAAGTTARATVDATPASSNSERKS
ncbi:MAG: hypothetical protein ACTH31_15365, partial [Pseudoclavibacter sp.]